MSERPVHSRPRRLADWLNPTAARKDHSLADQVGGWGPDPTDSFDCGLRQRVGVKAACGKTARAV
jgi:hypothetical protein